MRKRTFATAIATAAAGAFSQRISAQPAKPTGSNKVDFTFSQTDSTIKLFVGGAQKTKIAFISDTHFSYSNGLEEPYLDYAYRMHSAFAAKPKVEALTFALKSAERAGCSLAVLGGDIINFPSQYNVEKLAECMAASKVPCAYIAGNHDWHFEGSGVDIPQPELRRRWIEKLAPLYGGENPDGYTRVVNGIKFILVDDSANEISPWQLDFLKRELSDGKPTVLCMHIPLYVEGRNLGYSCGSPNFCTATDRSYRVERRHKRPERETPETFEFRDAALSAPNLLGVLAGHTHKRSTDFIDGKFQAVSARFLPDYDYLTLDISPKTM